LLGDEIDIDNLNTLKYFILGLLTETEQEIKEMILRELNILRWTAKDTDDLYRNCILPEIIEIINN